MTKQELKTHLGENTRVLKNPRLAEAYEAVDRARFVSEDLLDEAYEDYPLPIPGGQTVSQPTTVFFMLELLDPQPGEKVLDVGSGSGWTTALLAYLVGEGGEVIGVERVPELVAFGAKNLAKMHYAHAHIEQAGKEYGRSREAPFDRILVSAAAGNIPQALVDQLRVPGRMVIPVQGSIFVIDKKEHGYAKKEYPGFAFVPLI